jgi:hypothetical protein
MAAQTTAKAKPSCPRIFLSSGAVWYMQSMKTTKTGARISEGTNGSIWILLNCDAYDSMLVIVVIG